MVQKNSGGEMALEIFLQVNGCELLACLSMSSSRPEAAQPNKSDASVGIT